MDFAEPQSEFEVALASIPAPVLELSDRDQVTAILEDADVHVLPSVIDALDAEIDRRAQKRAGEALRSILRGLPETALTIALARVVLGSTEPLRTAAKRCHVSHVTLHNWERKIRAEINKPPLSRD